jgi:hypothetical protein
MITGIAIGPAPADALTSVQFVDDLDTLIASAKCSCSAGDDNPY